VCPRIVFVSILGAPTSEETGLRAFEFFKLSVRGVFVICRSLSRGCACGNGVTCFGSQDELRKTVPLAVREREWKISAFIFRPFFFSSLGETFTSLFPAIRRLNLRVTFGSFKWHHLSLAPSHVEAFPRILFGPPFS
jgi:hypothetical protein